MKRSTSSGHHATAPGVAGRGVSPAPRGMQSRATVGPFAEASGAYGSRNFGLVPPKFIPEINLCEIVRDDVIAEFFFDRANLLQPFASEGSYLS